MRAKVSFTANVARFDCFNVEAVLSICGVDIIDLNFGGEISKSKYFRVKDISDNNESLERKIIAEFYIEFEKENFEKIKHKFEEHGARFFEEEISELSNTGNFKIQI